MFEFWRFQGVSKRSIDLKWVKKRSYVIKVKECKYAAQKEFQLETELYKNMWIIQGCYEILYRVSKKKSFQLRT